MSYEKTLLWEAGQEIEIEYSMSPEGLKLDSWRLFYHNTEIVPSRDVSLEIEELVAKFLETEYSIYGYSYEIEMLESAWLSSRG